MTYPLMSFPESRSTRHVGGMYSNDEKQRIELILENKPVADVVAYIEEHADLTPLWCEESLNYVRGKKEYMLDVLKLDGRLIVHYTNRKPNDKYYHTFRITSFRVTGDPRWASEKVL